MHTLYSFSVCAIVRKSVYCILINKAEIVTSMTTTPCFITSLIRVLSEK